jgi:aconitate hydratase
VAQKDFNSYGSRRGNHEVMIRGTFANIRLKNELVAAVNDGQIVEGGYTRLHAGRRPAVVHLDASRTTRRRAPARRLRRQEHGSGSSRDWAAKGTSPSA